LFIPVINIIIFILMDDSPLSFQSDLPVKFNQGNSYKKKIKKRTFTNRNKSNSKIRHEDQTIKDFAWVR
jgi:hypothetical protein